jgi:phosphate acetyltransferase
LQPFAQLQTIMNELIAQCIEKAGRSSRRLVLPEGDDARVQTAALQIRELGIATPVLLGEPSALRQSNADLADIEIMDTTAEPDASMADALIGRRRKITAETVGEYLALPAYRGAALLNNGSVDAMVAGAVLPTARVMEAAFAVGPKPGLKTLSSFFLMSLQSPLESVSRDLLFADCALNIEPDAEQLAEIAITSADSARRLLGTEPRVAMLSFSTHGSASHHSVTKVAEAVALVREKAPEIHIEGELQVDTALSRRVASTKLKDTGEVAGQANVLIFPDLNAGNIAYKLVQYCGGAQATGPVLQGFAKPVCDLSRGATVEDIVAAAAVTISLSL